MADIINEELNVFGDGNPLLVLEWIEKFLFEQVEEVFCEPYAHLWMVVEENIDDEQWVMEIDWFGVGGWA